MKKAIIFSGQGAQYPGMMKDLYENFDSVKELFEVADSALGKPITEMCFYGSQEELNLTQNTQPCMLAADLAAAFALREKGFKPDALAGFSLGEYAALVYSGVISVHDAFEIVQVRADAMQEAVRPGEGAMVAIIGTSVNIVEKLCDRIKDYYIDIANFNSPVQTVVSGTAEGVNCLISVANDEGIKTIKLPVSAPFHCKLMEPASIQLRRTFQYYSFKKPEIPVFFNIDGRIHYEEIDELLVKQAMYPVRWIDTLQNMYSFGVDTFIECGPGKTLSGFVKKTLKGVSVSRVEDNNSLEKTISVLKR